MNSCRNLWRSSPAIHLATYCRNYFNNFFNNFFGNFYDNSSLFGNSVGNSFSNSVVTSCLTYGNFFNFCKSFSKLLQWFLFLFFLGLIIWIFEKSFDDCSRSFFKTFGNLLENSLWNSFGFSFWNTPRKSLKIPSWICSI